jgi:hypothetical protein
MSLNTQCADIFAPAKDETCFYCGDPVYYPNIQWHGSRLGEGSDMFLHPICARTLSIRLLRDVWEAECKHIITER